MTKPSDFAAAERIVNSDPVIKTFAAPEWDELTEDGQIWIAAIIHEATHELGAEVERARQIIKGWAYWHRMVEDDPKDDLPYLNGKAWDDAEVLACMCLTFLSRNRSEAEPATNACSLPEAAPVDDPFISDRFADMWSDYTDANWMLVKDPTSFLENCEEVGLAECVPVDDDALAEPFAAERGIEPGGMMWRLTAKGHERYSASRNTTHRKGPEDE